MLYNEPNGFFAESTDPRIDRTHIKYHVGQVIMHKQFGYRGVIYGWDYKTKVR